VSQVVASRYSSQLSDTKLHSLPLRLFLLGEGGLHLNKPEHAVSLLHISIFSLSIFLHCSAHLVLFYVRHRQGPVNVHDDSQGFFEPQGTICHLSTVS
jgi:hypothetical protein